MEGRTQGNVAWLVIALVVGVIAGVGLGALLFGGDDDDSGGSAGGAAPLASKQPIELPDELAGGFTEMTMAVERRKASPSAIEAQRDRAAKVGALTEDAYSKAFGGGSAAYKSYADDALEKLPHVIAVRADVPGLVIGPVEDPVFLRLATPTREVKAFGDVECQILWTPPTLEGQTPDPETQSASNCQRSASGVTVFVHGGGFNGPDGVRQMVDLTNAAWDAASG